MTDETVPANWVDEETGLACAIVRGPMGALNGYVAVPPSHPWFQVGYSTALCQHEGCWEHSPESIITVHGGITYAGSGVTGAEQNEGRWWFGFDTAHAGDLVPGLAERGVSFGDEVERPFDYVKGQCKSMARQLAEVRPETGRE